MQSSETTDFWVELYTQGNTIVKVKRSEYLEYSELMNPDYIDEKHTKNYYRIIFNESVNWTYRHKIDDLH